MGQTQGKDDGSRKHKEKTDRKANQKRTNSTSSNLDIIDKFTLPWDLRGGVEKVEYDDSVKINGMNE